MAEGNGTNGPEQQNQGGEGRDTQRPDTPRPARKKRFSRLVRHTAAVTALTTAAAGLLPGDATSRGVESAAAQTTISAQHVSRTQEVGGQAASEEPTAKISTDEVRGQLADEDVAAQKEQELAEERQYGEAFSEFARRVKKEPGDPEHVSIDQASKSLDMPPEVFTLFLGLDDKLTAFKNAHEDGERDTIINDIVKSCTIPATWKNGEVVSPATWLTGPELEAFIRKVRPDVGEKDRTEIVEILNTRQASVQRPSIKELPKYERDEIEKDLNETESMGKVVKETLVQKAAGMIEDKVLIPIHDWLEQKQHKLEHWLHPEEPGKEWTKRGFKFLLALIKYSFYMIIWMMSVVNKLSGKSGGGGRGH